MSSLNKILLLGTIVSEIEHKESTDGQSLSRFTLCVSRPERQDGVPSGEDNVPIIAKANASTVCQSLAKGALLQLEGRVCTGRSQSEDGSFTYFTEVEALQLTPLSSVSFKHVPAQDHLDAHTAPGQASFNDLGAILETKAPATDTFSFDTKTTPSEEAELEETVPF
ncbi:MAG: single-stranded DNA-binding protein [bacterium]